MIDFLMIDMYRTKSNEYRYSFFKN